MKRNFSLFLILLLALIFVGCNGGEIKEESLEADKEIIGTWISTVDHSDHEEATDSEMTYTFNEDGTYTLNTKTEVTDENGQSIFSNSTSEGQFTIDGDKLNLKELRTNNDTPDEELEAIDNSITGEPEKETQKEFEETTYDLSIKENTLIMTLGNTRYEFTKVK